MEKLKFYTRFNPPPSPSLKCEDASLTRQEFVQESDLNNIMKRYAAGMPLPTGNRPPLFDDFSNLPDYQQAFHIVQNSNEKFMQLPSDVRKRFNNNPQELLEFLQNNANRDEAVKLGLLKAPVSDQKQDDVSVPATKVEGDSK